MTALIRRFGQTIGRWWPESRCATICRGLSGFFARLGQGSVVCRLLGRSDSTAALSHSVVGRLFEALDRTLARFSQQVGQPMAKGSLLVRLGSSLFERICALTLRQTGSFLASFGLVLLAASQLHSGLPALVLPISAALVAMGLVLFVCPARVDTALTNSGLIRWVTNCSVLDRLPENSRSRTFWFAVCGMVCAGLVTLSPLYGAAAICGLIGGVVLLARPEIGVYLCAAAAPFLPTMVLAALVCVVFACYVAKLLFGSGLHLRLDLTGVYLLLFGGLLLFFGITSYTPASSIQIALLECVFLIGYFLIYNLVTSKAKVRLLLFSLVTGGLGCGLIGLWQYLSGMVDQTWTDTDLFEGLSVRIYSTLENPNVYGEYLLLILPLCAALFLTARRLVPKLYYLGVGGILLVNLALTYSRGCYLAILLALLLFVFLVARKLLLIGVAGLCALPFVLPASIISRFASITNLTDSSTSYRIGIWVGTTRMLHDFWLLGIGLGEQAFRTVYPRYALNSVTAPHAHSLFLQVLSEMGIAGFLCLALLLGSFVNTMTRAFRRANKRGRILLAAVLCGVLGFVFEGLFEYIWYNYRVFFVFIMTLGLGAAMADQTAEGGCPVD